MQPVLDVKNIECRYQQRVAVHDVSLRINDGDLLSLLGPSGCGKTTVLRAIAGFESVSSGNISLRNEIVSKAGYTKPPENRHIGMVFQDYALFPHMDVQDNIGFGLRQLSAKDRNQRVKEMLKIVDLSDYADRYVHELSGGQQQRIALARALAPKPDLVLMDEPFSNLDVEMREYLSQEVRQILKSQGATGILVTHDQLEAFAVADHIGVMNMGEIVQHDTAYNLYHSPNNYFVADFIGQGVFLEGTLLAPDKIETPLGIIKGDRAYDWPRGSKVKLLIRPDDIVHDEQGNLVGEVCNKAFKGAEILYTLRLSSGIEVLSLFPSHHNYELKERVKINFAPDHMVAFKV
ncbi:Ferric iron ABC transporter, ATP-binding protein [hydrothermal vent metagenome]|uniref:Ferric iron ABC transporter, ATP-binding protein n=1 Tax=hydrothermal vent metagenome TaxID=652676 RepID=A0A3B1AP56_9ZZZZ